MSLLRNLWLKSTYFNVMKRTVHQEEKLHGIDKKFTTIYQLPQIGICAVVNKCKVPYLLGVGALVPGSYAGYAVEAFTSDVPITVSAVGLASTAALFAMGQAFTRLIGFVYISEDKKLVKISYLDLWGRRMDELHHVKDVINISEPSWPANLFYKHLNISSTSKPYKISVKFGNPVRISLLNEVFNYDFYGEE